MRQLVNLLRPHPDRICRETNGDALTGSEPMNCNDAHQRIKDGCAKILDTATEGGQTVAKTNPDIELPQGQVFAGRYRIEKLLGEGDRKRTYLAEDILVGDRLVALSVVKPEAVHLDSDGTRREANLLSRVGSHSHIVAFHDRNPPGSPAEYLVFEYLRGGTLADLIEQAAAQADLPPPQLIVRFGRQLAGALAQVHSAGLIHRDVAPHNIWLASQGSKDKVKLGDFDSAVLIDEMPEHRPITSDGFVSPEELRDDALDQRSDLYSLGGVLISLVRSRLGFDEPERLREERPDFPPALTELLISLVALDPDERPGSAEEVLSRLRQIDQSLDLYRVISSGEGPNLEFKSSMLFPHEKPQLPPTSTEEQLAAALAGMPAKLEQAVVKSIAAFLNSSHGGTLLVGVADNGMIVGIEADFPLLSDRVGCDVDGWQRHLNSIVTSRLDGDVWIALQLTLHTTDRGTVARIHCPPRTQPTWYTFEGRQEFYVRGPAASDPLPAPLWSQYIKERWLS